MRYIGRVNQSTLVQVDPDKNSYINVKSFGATGLDEYFVGRVKGTGGGGSVMFIGDVPNYSSYEKDYFKVGQEIQAFFYLDTSTPGSIYQGIFTNAASAQTGNLVAGGLPTSKTLNYYIFPFNPSTGVLSPYYETISIANVYKDPKTQFNEDNYIKLTFNRPDSNWLPIIFRKWGSGQIEFLGIPSNDIFGELTSITFNDRGPVEIPFWDETALTNGEFFPEFLSSLFTKTSQSISSKAIVQKRRLKIIARSLTGVIEFEDAEIEGGSFSNLDNTSLRVLFKFDDTKAIQDAIDLSVTNNLKDVFFPAGTYNIRNIKLDSADLNPKDYSGIVLRGSGESSIIKRLAATNNPIGEYGTIGLLGTGVSGRVEGVTIANLAFNGNKTETFPLRSPEVDTYGIGNKYFDSIAMEYADSVRILNCAFYNGFGSAIYSLNSDKINISDNRIYNLSKPYESNISPVKIRESSRVIVQGNLFEQCSGELDFTGIEASTINNNIVNNCGDTGFKLQASATWNATNNLTFNQSGSLIRTVDLYDNEYTRVSLDVKRGQVMTPVYFTVTEGNLPVDIVYGSVVARIYPLNSSYNYNTSATESYFQVVESKPQLQAGIFALTAPVSDINSGTGGSNQGKKILGTSNFDLLNPGGSKYGYAYKITATVGVGRYPISKIVYSDTNKVKIYFKNEADLLSIKFFGAGSSSNDQIRTLGVGVPNTELSNWPDELAITLDSIDENNAALEITTPSSVSAKFDGVEDEYATPGGYLTLVKSNYFIADGNIYISE